MCSGLKLVARLPWPTDRESLLFWIDFKHRSETLSDRRSFLMVAIPLVYTELGKIGFKYFSVYKQNEWQKLSDFSGTFLK